MAFLQDINQIYYINVGEASTALISRQQVPIFYSQATWWTQGLGSYLH